MLGARLAALGFAKKFNPLQLFQKGATGAWYDPSSLWGAADHLARRNLLTSTATLATQTKTVTAVSHTLYIKGTGSVTLSGVATGTLNGTGASDRVSLTFTPTAGSLTLTVSGTVTEGHLTTTATLDHSYQKVTDWTTELYAHAASKNVPWLRRNLYLYSDSLTTESSTAWHSSRGTVSTVTVGGLSCTKILCDETSTGGVYWARGITAIGVGLTGTSILSGTKLRFIARMYLGTRNYAQIYIYSTDATHMARAQFNLSTGSFDSSSTSGSAITYDGNSISGVPGYTGWYDCEISATVNTTSFGVIIAPSKNQSDTNCTINVDYGYCAGVTVAVIGSSSQVVTHQPIGASWEAQFAANAAAAGVALTMYQDSAGTTPVTGPDSVVGKLNDLSGGGYHAIQSGATGLKPTLRLCPNGKWYIQRDLSDDNLIATFPNLGTACATYVAESTGVTKATGVTINGATNLNTPATDYGRIILNAESAKDAQIQKWLLAKVC